MVMTQKDIEGMAEDALNLAVKHIQDALGVKSGDFAGLFFSDEYVQRILADYIRAEISDNQNALTREA